MRFAITHVLLAAGANALAFSIALLMGAAAKVWDPALSVFGATVLLLAAALCALGAHATAFPRKERK